MRNLRTLGLRAVTLRSGVGRVDGDHPALLHNAQMVQDPILETPVRDGGPLAGRPVVLSRLTRRTTRSECRNRLVSLRCPQPQDGPDAPAATASTT